ncbi:MAG: DnaJ domain-containing protein, partial [Rhodospirillales bacterium]
MRDPYRILGLTPKAGAEDIKRAYRRLARELHPDTAKGDALAEDTFKDITAAYNLLSDPDQRAAFDRGDIDANGQKIRRGPQGGGRPGARPGGRKGPFDRFFRDKGASGHGASPVTVNGANVTYTLTVSFMEATRGCTKRINVATGKTLDVRLPPGTR